MWELSKFNNADFDRGSPRWREALWWFVRWAFFMTYLPIPSPFKVALLRAFGAEIGSGVVIRAHVNITFPWRLKIGDAVWIGDEVFILSLAEVNIGSNTCLSQRAFLCTGSHNHRKETFDLITSPIHIGESCWIGASAFIAPGVTLPNGTVCAAGSVITPSTLLTSGFSEGILLAGNPAQVKH